MVPPHPNLLPPGEKGQESRQALMSREQLREALDGLPRFPLGVFPTPLDDCIRLSEALGGPRILIKREDLTGFAFGGNKIRHFEFRIADVLERGFDVFVNHNNSISNNARISAAVCAKAGVRCVLVMEKSDIEAMQGNLLLDNILGVEIHHLDTADPDEVARYCRELGEQLRREGHTPYVQVDEPYKAHSAIFAYLDCTLELSEQLEELGVSECKTYQVTGNSVIGLTLGAKLLDLPWESRSFSPYSVDDVPDQAVDRSMKAAAYLGLPAALEAGEFNYSREFSGPDYGVVTPECIEAVRLVARTEAIFLDPVYTGKAMAGLISDVRKGVLGAEDTVVFFHSGGTPNIFTYAAELAE